MGVVKGRNGLRVEQAVGERGDGQNKSHQRTGSAYVKERPSGANRRTNQNECAERADERRKGNKKRVAGADVMMAAGEKMAEFMREQNGEQGESKRKARREGCGRFAEEGEGAENLVERNGLLAGRREGEVRAAV